MATAGAPELSTPESCMVKRPMVPVILLMMPHLFTAAPGNVVYHNQPEDDQYKNQQMNFGYHDGPLLSLSL
jgi:hypothetical protein